MTLRPPRADVGSVGASLESRVTSASSWITFAALGHETDRLSCQLLFSSLAFAMSCSFFMEPMPFIAFCAEVSCSGNRLSLMICFISSAFHAGL